MKQNFDLAQLTRFLKKEKAILAAYVFGSHAKGRANSSSDLDLAFLTAYPLDKKKKFEKKMRLCAELSSLLKKEVDLIFLEESSDLLGFEVIKTGELIYEKNKAKHREAVANIIIKYLDFQYLQKIMEKGLVRAIKEGLRKIAIIRESLQRLKGYSKLTEKEFLQNRDAQDIVLHNLFLAIQSSVDLGAHIIGDEGWGSPGSQSEIFYVLEEKKVIKPSLAKELIPATGMRNRLIHQYDKLDLSIVYSVIKERLKYFEQLIKSVSLHFKLD